MKPTDATTLPQLCSGSPREFPEPSAAEKLTLETFDNLRRPLSRYLSWIRLRPDRVEDIIQEAFLRLYEHLRRQRLSEGNLRGWVWKVAHNLALKQLATENREGSFVSLEEGVHYAIVDLKDPKPDPEENLCLDQKQRRVLRALDELSERERQCLHLRSEGLGYREIGEVLGIGRSTVASVLNRAIETLHKAIHE
jgi:RNA polymerase sigma-70 factor, ECF subfamily